jgi:hypothetical protein
MEDEQKWKAHGGGDRDFLVMSLGLALWVEGKGGKVLKVSAQWLKGATNMGLSQKQTAIS